MVSIHDLKMTPFGLLDCETYDFVLKSTGCKFGDKVKVSIPGFPGVGCLVVDIPAESLDGEWNHVTIVRNGGKILTYINGLELSRLGESLAEYDEAHIMNGIGWDGSGDVRVPAKRL